MDAKLSAAVPFAARDLLRFLSVRAIPGIEAAAGGVYRRTLRLPGGPGTLAVRAAGDGVAVEVHVAVPADRPAAEAAARALLDLDCDVRAVARTLGADALLGPLVRSRPGTRVPGHPDPAELAIRAVIGQQVSVAAARTVAARLVAEHGEPLPRPVDGLTRVFPHPAALAALRPEHLPMPRARGRALTGLAGALAAGDLVLDRGGDPETARSAMRALPGIGPWTADYVALRALGDRDAFLATDLGVRRALERLGADGSPRAAAARAERWRPYRAYALVHLWNSLDQGGSP